MEKTPQLPKRLIDYNKFRRVSNFDTEKCDGYHQLIEIDREFDHSKNCFIMWCVPRDVIEDSTSLFTKGDAGKTKNTPISVVVHKNNYQIFGKGELSNAYDWVWILPAKVENLPMGITKGFPEMTKLLGERHTEMTIKESQRNQIDILEETLKTVDRGLSPEQVDSILKIAKNNFPSSQPPGDLENDKK